jgi:glutamine amidotransferase
VLAILNYNMGNLASVVNALKKLGVDAVVESDPDKIKEYDKIILPGVGAFGDAMEHLESVGMDSAIIEYANSGKYMLGICLGMQLLFEKSEEFGDHKGLGILKGEVKRFRDRELKIPHMGWNIIFPRERDTIFSGMENPYLYFVHSYYVESAEENILGETEYGIKFTSSVNRENIFGLQPHPEKSHENGLKILKNFVNL